MTLERHRLYWLSHPEYGTMRAELRACSENRVSLLFSLPHAVGLRVGGSLAIVEFLALAKLEKGYAELHTGELWEISEDEPASKLPTK